MRRQLDERHPRLGALAGAGYAVWRASSAAVDTGVTWRAAAVPVPAAAASPELRPRPRRSRRSTPTSRLGRAADDGACPAPPPGEGEAGERHLPRARRRQLRRAPSADRCYVAPPTAAEADGLRAPPSARRVSRARSRWASTMPSAGAELRRRPPAGTGVDVDSTISAASPVGPLAEVELVDVDAARRRGSCRPGRSSRACRRCARRACGSTAARRRCGRRWRRCAARPACRRACRRRACCRSAV